MAKSTMSRHSKTSRKPVTIDLDPSDVKPVKGAGQVAEPKPAAKTVPPAEPVGDPVTAPRTKSAQASPRAETAQVTPRAKSGQTQSVPPLDSPSPASNNAEKTMNSSRTSSAAPSAKTASPWLAGLAGGVIVLLGTTALQYSGYGLFSTTTAPDPALTAQVTKLEQQLSALQATSKPDADLLVRLEAAEKNATASQAQLAALSEKFAAQPAGDASDDSGLRSEFSDLHAQVAALQAAVSVTDNSALDSLRQRLTEMDAKLNNTITETAQATATLNNDDTAVKELQTQFATLQAKLDQQAKQPDMAAVVAANALKATIDRGGSFNNELQTFASLVPAVADKLQGLETLAATGVPTLNQLAAKFPILADEMVAQESKPGTEAGAWDQLVGSVKGLVRSRPIGDVAGDDAGAIAARIEFALQHDDVQRAVAEWAKLPENAKQIGQSFYAELVARRDADALMTGLIADVAQSKATAE